jgi:hypothetical protein
MRHLRVGQQLVLTVGIVGAIEYERVPRHLQARVLGAVGASAWVGIPFGSLRVGFSCPP